jgi:hypothetical protein
VDKRVSADASNRDLRATKCYIFYIRSCIRAVDATSRQVSGFDGSLPRLYSTVTLITMSQDGILTVKESRGRLKYELAAGHFQHTAGPNESSPNCC